MDDGAVGARAELVATLRGYVPTGDVEEADVGRVLRVLESVADPWSRREPLHLTASAIVVHAASGRVLLRWHERFQRFMQVGGHGDPGEWNPLAIALREAVEETGLPDLRPFERGDRGVGGELIHVVVVPVPARADEAAHEHADLRFLLETAQPDEARPESSAAPVRWVSFGEAVELVGEENLRLLLERARALLA
jgi:8-oxo-dGTP pyrophosphatase MutT (NUDIX family)